MFQSIIDHMSSSKNSFSQVGGVSVLSTGVKADVRAVAELGSISRADESVVAANIRSLWLVACATVGSSLAGSARRRVTICWIAAVVLRTGSCDPNCCSSRSPVHSISKQSLETWLLWCTAPNARTKHALSK